MNVLLISQCTKRAREVSCRILDRFAERKGDSTWQTAITQEGLETLRSLLRKTARRNSAVACHWLKKSGQTELLWIVGNQRRFNAQGNVPTHRTSRDIVCRHQEHSWHSAEAVALLAAIAGLFHDVGKSNALFQACLAGNATPRYQPFRHEWVSLRLFQAFVDRQTDREWTAALGALTEQDEARWLARLDRDSKTHSGRPFAALPPLAKVVAWLILSHHRLPQDMDKRTRPDIGRCDTWLENQLNADWNSMNRYSERLSDSAFQAVWQFPHGTPLRSRTWREKARQISRRAASAPALFDYGTLDQLFTLHLARLTLMLADHYYSSGQPDSRWQDPDCPLWANTERASGKPKQKLDEHNVGVGHNALLLGRALPWVRRSLPSIARHKEMRKRATDARFYWQNQAWDVAAALRERSRTQGFFGINMASTGCGKTFANARIMYALSEEQEGCRFTVALGLRTLTLQTGRALRQRLMLEDDDLAVMVGSQAVRDLHQLQTGIVSGSKADDTTEDDADSASQEALFETHQYVHYDGSLESGPLRHWLTKDKRLASMLSAPVLVSTIDHLMPATEGVRGGKQIPAMLRLLTSDLVLDEPDDFEVDDQYGVCRLVNMAGMLGARVLLSSATLAPSQVQALFAAWCKGREAFRKACGEPDAPAAVCCAWFDEYGATQRQVAGPTDFYGAHEQFIQRRVHKLEGKPVPCKARIAQVDAVSEQAASAIKSVANILYSEMGHLHRQHHDRHPGGKTVSLGLVRFANIAPLVAVMQSLAALPAPEDYCIHYCVYHSHYPLAVRAAIEQHLDEAFDRRKGNKPWRVPLIEQAIRHHPARHHIFVVLATSVCEVGRDWDADWGILEPSSMRSLVQFAGRIGRHRLRVPDSENLVILSHNIRGLRHPGNAGEVFCRPGFENKAFRLSSHSVCDLIPASEYRDITAIPRIVAPDMSLLQATTYGSLRVLEHARLYYTLLGKSSQVPVVAADWWRRPLTWNSELQCRTPFRQAKKEERLFLYMEADGDEPVFMMPPPKRGLKWKDPGTIRQQPFSFAGGTTAWIPIDPADILRSLADQLNIELGAACARFGEISLLIHDDHDDWHYHPFLGVFKEFC